MFSKLLIANRGEIACRVMRTARVLGYRTVAVFSDVDADAPHVQLADEAVHIGAAAAAGSYLDTDAVIHAARRTGADAIHPGYGFLSENAAFAQACGDADLVFIGPPPAAIAAMGDKARAKELMRGAGVPCAPGWSGAAQDDATLAEEAERLGFPLLVKAVAGGGGRGMRLVRSANELLEGIAGARREAQSAFGDGALMLERLIENGRHIEIQIFADAHGHAIHLGERDCTAQRRRQKVIEESPSPIVGSAMREAMGRDAVAAALAVGYVGAGTVEFIVDAELKHHFLEMNTRLQVEHPVTECVTGLDLVEWQLRIAAGEPLPLQQHEVRLQGHAIEARLYAEDPYAKPTPFAPQTGRVCWWRPGPVAARTGLRVDHGIAEGDDISPHYDAMVAKFIAHGRDRDDAIRRLRAALADAPLLGLRTNARFLSDLLDHAAFRGAALTTTRIDEWFEQRGEASETAEPLTQRQVPDEGDWCLAAALFAKADAPAWRSPGVAAFDLALCCDDETRPLRVQARGSGSARVTLGAQHHDIEILGLQPGELGYVFNGVRKHAVAVRDGGRLHLATGGATFTFTEPSALAPTAEGAADVGRLCAAVAGTVTRLSVRVGDAVVAGQPLVCVEAMKMEMWIAAPVAASVVSLQARVGDQVAAGAVLIELEPEKPT